VDRSHSLQGNSTIFIIYITVIIKLLLLFIIVNYLVIYLLLIVMLLLLFIICFVQGWVSAGRNLFLPDMRFKPD